MSPGRAADPSRLREQLGRTPDDGIAWLDLAVAEGNLGRAVEAEAAARSAIDLGFGAPEAHIVLARALQSQRKLDDAEREFEMVLRERPNYADAHRDYAQLVWMRSGSVERTLRRLDATLAASPYDAGLHWVRSIVLEFVGDPPAALASAERAVACEPGDAELLMQAARLRAKAGDAARALSLARAACHASPGSSTQIALCEALLAAGQVDSATTMIAQLREALPPDQYVIALQATAWRIRADPRYRDLHDYGSLVTVQTLDPPPGWTHLDGFLRDVVAEREALHAFVAHPFRQSVRGGGQLSLQEHDIARPVIRGLFASLHTAVARYMAGVGGGTDPMRSRNTGRAAFTGAWSVRLSSGGSHVDHVHPRGWLSSACYIALPSTIGSGVAVDSGTPDRAGWLRFGRPGIPTDPTLGADHFVRPEPGLLALFPAYIWHGVEPFVSEEPRLTVAFDVLPA